MLQFTAEREAALLERVKAETEFWSDDEIRAEVAKLKGLSLDGDRAFEFTVRMLAALRNKIGADIFEREWPGIRQKSIVAAVRRWPNG